MFISQQLTVDAFSVGLCVYIYSVGFNGVFISIALSVLQRNYVFYSIQRQNNEIRLYMAILIIHVYDIIYILQYLIIYTWTTSIKLRLYIDL